MLYIHTCVAVNWPRSIAVDLGVTVPNVSVTRIWDPGNTKSSLWYPILPAWFPGNGGESHHLQATAGTLGCLIYLLRGGVRVFTYACILWLDALVYV